jgi:hypothetical protein
LGYYTRAQLVDQLAVVDAAIARIRGTLTAGGAQSISVGGNQVVRAQLKELRQERTEILTAISRIDNSGAAANPVFGSRYD